LTRFKIPVAEPSIGEEEKQAVSEVMDSGFISQGEKVAEFEEKIAKYLGRKYAVACHSGTCANEIMAMALTQPNMARMIYRSEERIRYCVVPVCTSVAVSNPVVYAGFFPMFADLDSTLGIDIRAVEQYASVQMLSLEEAILNVYAYGSVNTYFSEMLTYCRKQGVTLLEDACVALGSEYNGRKVGSFGLMASLSFYANKLLTCGEGGMVVTDDEELATYCRRYVNHGRRKSVFHEEWFYEQMGRNAKMTDLQAAIGLAQFEKIDDFIGKRQKVAEVLADAVTTELGYSCFTPSSDIVPWSFWVVNWDGKKNMREKSMTLQTKYGVETRPMLPVIPHLPHYGIRKFFPVGYASQNGFMVSCSPKIIDDDKLSYLVESLEAVLYV